MHCSLARHGETGSVVVVIGIFSFLKIKVFIRIAPPPPIHRFKKGFVPKNKTSALGLVNFVALPVQPQHDWKAGTHGPGKVGKAVLVVL